MCLGARSGSRISLFCAVTGPASGGVTGWVKNMEDGTVTMELQGTTEQLAQLTAKIRAGSFFIKVEQLQLSDVTVVKGETVFESRY